jgi:hypothetical protein
MNFRQVLECGDEVCEVTAFVRGGTVEGVRRFARAQLKAA